MTDLDLDFCDQCGRLIRVPGPAFGLDLGAVEWTLCTRCGEALWAALTGAERR